MKKRTGDYASPIAIAVMLPLTQYPRPPKSHTTHLGVQRKHLSVRPPFPTIHLSPLPSRLTTNKRRSMALMFILDFVLQEGIVWRRGATRCGGGDPVPLPGPRCLWNYHNRESWAFRLERSRSMDSSLEPQLTLGDLRMAGEGDESNADKLARWCDGVDEFGGVLWMSATLV